MLWPLVVLPLVTLCPGSWGLDNGLAQTPPLGWATDERFDCNVDCGNYPDDCISESLVKSMADTLNNNGFVQAGYNYLAVGDCWQAKSRDSQGRLQPDAERFPSGIKSTVDYLHKRGMKLGMYLEAGNATRNGYPGSMSHLQTDVQTLADWGVDMVTLDAYSVQDTGSLDQIFPQVGDLLNRTGVPILYNCIWPVYQLKHGKQPQWSLIQKTCNMYRSHDEIIDSWESLKDTFKFFGDTPPTHLENYTGPGSWHSVSEVLVGDFGLSPDESRLQLAVWTILASPLFVSADLRHVTSWQKELLKNEALLRIVHDSVAHMGRQKMRYQPNQQVRIWTRPIQPKGSYALAFSYDNISGGPAHISVKLTDLDMTGSQAYNFTDVFTGRHIGVYKPWHTFDCEADPSGVLMINARAIP